MARCHLGGSIYSQKRDLRIITGHSNAQREERVFFKALRNLKPLYQKLKPWGLENVILSHWSKPYCVSEVPSGMLPRLGRLVVNSQLSTSNIPETQQKLARHANAIEIMAFFDS